MLLFGTGAAIALAEGIKTFLAKRGSKVEIRTRAGEIIATGDAVKN